jgi:plasmid stabilization system protein ParE
MDNRVRFSPEAAAALARLHRALIHRDSEASAAAFLDRFEAWCAELSEAPERGLRRDDLFPGLRVLGFERRMAVAYHIGLDTVTVDVIAHGARGRSALLEGLAGPPLSGGSLQG